jgi:hypothetical protein
MCLLAAGSARAHPPQLRLEGEVAHHVPLFGTARYTSLGLGGAFLVQPGVEAGGGARLLLGGLQHAPGVSAFAGVRLYAAQGPWQPALGLELEAAWNTRAAPEAAQLSGSLEQRYAAKDSALLRAGLVIAPLRIQLERLLLSVASIRLATPLDASAGQRLYLAVVLLHAGWQL